MTGHIVKFCPQVNGLRGTTAGDDLFIPALAHHGSQPIIDILVEGRRVKDLVNTGCSTTLIFSNLVDRWNGRNNIKAVDGREVRCRGTCTRD